MEGLVDPTVDRRLEDGPHAMAAADVQGAGEALGSTLVTPCEGTASEFTDPGDGHESACLLHECEHQRPEGSGDV